MSSDLTVGLFFCVVYGPSGVGKSTVTKCLQDTTLDGRAFQVLGVVELDDFLGSAFAPSKDHLCIGFDAVKWHQAMEMTVNRARSLLEEACRRMHTVSDTVTRVVVVVDTCHLRSMRKRFKKLLEEVVVHTFPRPLFMRVVFAELLVWAPLEVCNFRNASRHAGAVPPEVVEKLYGALRKEAAALEAAAARASPQEGLVWHVLQPDVRTKLACDDSKSEIEFAYTLCVSRALLDTSAGDKTTVDGFLVHQLSDWISALQAPDFRSGWRTVTIRRGGETAGHQVQSQSTSMFHVVDLCVRKVIANRMQAMSTVEQANAATCYANAKKTLRHLLHKDNTAGCALRMSLAVLVSASNLDELETRVAELLDGLLMFPSNV